MPEDEPMPKLRNISGEDRELYDGRRVPDDGVVEISEPDWDALDWDQPAIWAVVTTDKKPQPAKAAEQE